VREEEEKSKKVKQGISKDGKNSSDVNDLINDIENEFAEIDELLKDIK